MGKQKLIKTEQINLTEEAKQYIENWTSKQLDFFRKEEESNWILALDRVKKYFVYLSVKEGCKSGVFGNIQHVESIYKF